MMVAIKYSQYQEICLKAQSGDESKDSKQNPKLSKKCVPPFSYQSLRPDAIVCPPARSYPYKPKSVRTSLFRRYFLRGDIPLVKKTRHIKRSTDPEVQRENKSNLNWSVPPRGLDYSYYLPIFFEGLAESEEPYMTLAREGSHELVSFGADKVLPVLPQLIMPLKRALNTKLPDVIVAVLKVLQHMVKSVPCVGQALVPYYRQLLPTCNLFRSFNVNLGGQVDHGRESRVGDVIEDTLRVLEKHGGPDAYINIKYMIPTYESYNCN